MNLPFKLTALAVALGVAGAASAQQSTTALNIIAFDPTTNNYVQLVTSQPATTGTAYTGAPVSITLSSFSAWATYTGAEGASLANTEFIVFTETSAGRSTAGDFGYSGALPAQNSVQAAAWSQTAGMPAFTGTSFEGNFSGTSYATAASFTGANNDFGGLTGASVVATNGGTEQIVYAVGSGAVSGALETATLSTTSGNITFAAVSAVPEPGTFAMMGAGLLAVGAIVRRRTRR